MINQLAPLAAVAALLVAAPAAQADHIPSNLGIEVTAVDPASRTVNGILHCTTPDRAGRPASFPVTRDIEFAQFRPGLVSGIAVDPSGVIQSTGPMPCDVRPMGPPPVRAALPAPEARVALPVRTATTAPVRPCPGSSVAS